MDSGVTDRDFCFIRIIHSIKINVADIDRKFIHKSIVKAGSLEELFRIEKKYFGRKGGLLTLETKKLKDLSDSQKRKVGRELNELKSFLKSELEVKKIQLESKPKTIDFDPTEPGHPRSVGHTHLITKVRKEIEEYFQSIGFAVMEGPEVENEYYNFEALNIPEDHPARDMWDTFWLKPDNQRLNIKNQNLLLRTHTSPMQIRVMEKTNPPLAVIVPGRTFRHEATDATHEHTFDQVEGFMVDENVSVANLKSVLHGLFRHLFDDKVEIELRPSYFPFTEPSFELFMRNRNKFGGNGWLEMLGSGMIHPKVFEHVGYKKGKYTGFAFGLGISRVAMLKYGIPDIRMFYDNDLRVLRQF